MRKKRVEHIVSRVLNDATVEALKRGMLPKVGEKYDDTEFMRWWSVIEPALQETLLHGTRRRRHIFSRGDET